MYPNPADDYVNVTFGTDRIKNAVIAISDLVGKDVYRAEIGDPNPGATHRINTSEFREGIYILQMISGDLNTSRKLIVNR
jgi:hypothetical protein